MPTSNGRENNGKSGNKIGPVRTWALATGGMVGGGIYIALGVVIDAAGQWAWLSFLIAGIAALVTANSYGRLSNHFGKGGGAFEFLEELGDDHMAGVLSWLLILGYTLTISVYAYAFGNYMAHGCGLGGVMIRLLAVGAMVVLIALNLLGVGKLTSVEVVLVMTNLLVLLLLAAVGLWLWEPSQLTAGIEAKSLDKALFGAAAIFVSYEGFQLLCYEYKEIEAPKKYFVPVLVSASAVVILIYIGVTLGATMLAGAGKIVEKKEIALSIAATKAMGLPGLIAMTIAAVMATSAAINSTLFSTAKLASRIAKENELPGWFSDTNRHDIPYKAVLLIGSIAASLAAFGSLSSLVEAASLVFAGTFLTVNVLCFQTLSRHRWTPAFGVALCAIIGVFLCIRLVMEKPVAFGLVCLAIMGAVALRYRLSRT